MLTVILFILEWFIVERKIVPINDGQNIDMSVIKIIVYIFTIGIVLTTSFLSYKFSIFFINLRLRLSKKVKFKSDFNYYKEGLLITFLLTACANLLLNLLFDFSIMLNGLIAVGISVICFLYFYRNRLYVLQVVIFMQIISFLINAIFVY